MEEKIKFYRNFHLIMKHCPVANKKFGRRPIFPVLHYIKVHNNYVKYSDIVDNMPVTKGRVSQFLTMLEEEGLITKTLENNSRKQSYYSLTSNGEAELNKLKPIVQKQIDDLYEYMGEKDAKEFNRLVDKILAYEEDLNVRL